MLSVRLAKLLQTAGLIWRPRQFDFFHIPDRDLDDKVFVISDLSAEVQPIVDGLAAIAFNGAVEWSLDYILQQDVVWLPTETQIRSQLGDAVQSLERVDDGWHCVIIRAGGEERHAGATASDAYGAALLAMLTQNT